jgi:hypothetical protein
VTGPPECRATPSTPLRLRYRELVSERSKSTGHHRLEQHFPIHRAFSADGSTLAAEKARWARNGWTFANTTANGGKLILLSGQSAANGAAVELEVANGGNLYADNSYGQWWEWNGSGWISSTNPLPSSSPPPPPPAPPPPPPSSISPDGSTLFPGGSGSLMTGAGTWTFANTTANGGKLILLNGQSAANGAAVELEVANSGNLYADNSYGQWWKWNGSGWTSSTNPLPSSPPQIGRASCRERV